MLNTIGEAQKQLIHDVDPRKFQEMVTPSTSEIASVDRNRKMRIG